MKSPKRLGPSVLDLTRWWPFASPLLTSTQPPEPVTFFLFEIPRKLVLRILTFTFLKILKSSAFYFIGWWLLKFLPLSYTWFSILNEPFVLERLDNCLSQLSTQRFLKRLGLSALDFDSLWSLKSSLWSCACLLVSNGLFVFNQTCKSSLRPLTLTSPKWLGLSVLDFTDWRLNMFSSPSCVHLSNPIHSLSFEKPPKLMS